ncbi:N-6 DNA methylase [Blautia hydrogenotrophica]|uniref:N-6 DNA methylase n=1 Tax=Blautia hydrogenotrophica TaxID=53443 RepID=UPI002E76BC67|nr:N-6 DNA methylase [Blautia hydrogenotrophica]MEE0464092.1 N-6 DNA methylase [Blautia hydrogenotrophica]
MNLNELFKNTSYDDTLFSTDGIAFIEAAVFMKPIKGMEVPYIKCLVRDKDIKLTPEEAVRQLYIYKLIHEYGYPTDRIQLETPIHFGREVKRADITIMDKDCPTVPYIIVELKKPKLTDGKEQLKSYCNATGAPIGVWTNGEQVSCYNRKDPNFFEMISDIPKATQKLSDILSERYTYDDLRTRDKISKEKRSLRNLIKEMEDEVLASAGVDSFEEIFKLIFAKLYDELICANDKTAFLQFRNSGDTDFELKEKIQSLFDDAKKKWEGVFPEESKILLSPSHLAVCVSTLQDIKLFNNNLDVVDDAFEYLMSKAQKGEKGQYFTPRYVIDMCVKMMNPTVNDKIIDTACGSSGFTVHSIFKVWKEIRLSKGLEPGENFTASERTTDERNFVRDNVFAIDFDEKTVRVARTLNLIAGDGQTNVLHLNTLDYSRWNEVTKQEDWNDTYNEGFKKLKKLQPKGSNDFSKFNFDLVMANPPFAGDIKEPTILSHYELAKNDKGKWQKKVGRDILFIERNLNFLKPGGRMAVVLPQGRFNNSSDKYIRNFIAERCRILAVVGLHGNVFKPHTGTKTSVLFVQKWDDKLCPKKDDYPIFFATMQKPSKDNSGEKIYVKDENGEIKLDSHGHFIVEHDLYNHDGMTQDGIVEAFIEFAKKEGLSFFQ